MRKNGTRPASSSAGKNWLAWAIPSVFRRSTLLKNPLSAVVLALLAPCLAYGQVQPDTPPKPVQKLGYYVGTWEGHGETKGGPFGPAGKLSSRMTCNWFAGKFQIVCRGEETGPTGKREFLNIKSYDQKTKTYTEYSVSSLGESEYSRGGTLAGDKLTYVLHADAGEKAPKIRYTEVHVSPILQTYKAEAALVGSPWKVIAEGRIVKR